VDEILGLVPTGRELRDPASRLVEARDEEGRHYTVIDFDDDHLGHEGLTLNVEMVLSFMQFPMVTGLVGLDRYDLEKGQFAFGTGSVWTIRDVHRAFGDFGQVVGMRAGLELAWLAAQVLVEAGETGPMQGCFSHGNVCPTRLALRGDGMVQVFGHGLPQVEILRHQQEGYPLEPESLYYCTPERLEGVPEDAAADTYALTLVVYELITGKPLYDTHDVEELRRMVGMSEGATMLSRTDRGLPQKVAKLFARSLIYDPDTRLSGEEYVDGIGRLLANEALDGPSLSEVVETLQGQAEAGPKRGRKLVSAKSTTAFTPEMLAAMAAEEDEDEDDDGEDSEQSPRWKKVTRGRRSASDDDEDPDSGADEDDDEDEDQPKRKTRRGSRAKGRSRRRRRGSSDDESTSASTKRRRRRRADADADADAGDDEADEAPSKTRRRRRRGDTEDSQEAKAQAPSRRRRRKTDDADDADDAEGQDGAGSSRTRRRRRRDDDDDEPTRRRRRRKASDDDDDDAPRRRRRRKKTSDDDDPPPKRRRRKKAPDADESDAGAPKPTRRRRKKAPDANEDDAGEAKPTRRRRKKAPDADEDDAGDAKPTRRRRKKAPDADEDDAGDAKPTRKRRKKASVSDDDADDAKPTRRRRRKKAASTKSTSSRRRRRKKPTDEGD